MLCKPMSRQQSSACLHSGLQWPSVDLNFLPLNKGLLPAQSHTVHLFTWPELFHRDDWSKLNGLPSTHTVNPLKWVKKRDGFSQITGFIWPRPSFWLPSLFSANSLGELALLLNLLNSRAKAVPTVAFQAPPLNSFQWQWLWFCRRPAGHFSSARSNQPNYIPGGHGRRRKPEVPGIPHTSRTLLTFERSYPAWDMNCFMVKKLLFRYIFQWESCRRAQSYFHGEAAGQSCKEVMLFLK